MIKYNLLVIQQTSDIILSRISRGAYNLPCELDAPLSSVDGSDMLASLPKGTASFLALANWPLPAAVVVLTIDCIADLMGPDQVQETSKVSQTVTK